MGRKPNNYNHVIQTLQDLHKLYPNYTMCMHLATALDGYRDIWGITDKELLFALDKYKAQLDMEPPHAEGDELNKIIEEGMNLSMSNLLGEDDEDIREQEEY